MCADIHYGQEHQSSTHGPDTEVQHQSLHRSHRACNTRPVHTDSAVVFCIASFWFQPRSDDTRRRAVRTPELSAWRSPIRRGLQGSDGSAERIRYFRLVLANETKMAPRHWQGILALRGQLDMVESPRRATFPLAQKIAIK